MLTDTSMRADRGIVGSGAAVRWERNRAMARYTTCYRITDVRPLGAFYKSACGLAGARGTFDSKDSGRSTCFRTARRRAWPRLGAEYNFRRGLVMRIGTGYGHIAITSREREETDCHAHWSEKGIEPQRDDIFRVPRETDREIGIGCA